MNTVKLRLNVGPNHEQTRWIAIATTTAWVCLIPALALLAVTDRTTMGVVIMSLIALAAVLSLVSMVFAWTQVITVTRPLAEDSGGAFRGDLGGTDEPSMVELLLTMHHELRTPLNAVVGAAELLEAPDDPALADLVGIVRQGANAALGLVNDVLELSRIEARGVGVRPVPVPVRQIVGDAVTLLGPTAVAAKVELTRDVNGVGDLEVLADERRLKQVLLNLVSNALKFTPAFGSVSVTVRRIAVPDTSDSGMVRLEFAVSDTGVGLSEDEIGRLFRPYAQAGPGSDGKHGGSGLGLLISRRIVEAMGGRLGVRSTPGVGSTFYFSVLVQQAPVQPGTSPRTLAGGQVLFLGRSTEVGAVVAGALDGLGLTTHLVDPAAVDNGLPVPLQLLDLIVIEQFGSGGDTGAALASVLDPATSTIPIVVITRPNQPEQWALGVTPAAKITFPVRPEVIRERIRTVLCRRAAKAPVVVEEGHRDYEGLRVLLVEDDEINSRVMVLALRRLGVEPEVMSDGAHALAAMAPGGYHLVLLDHDLPGLSGPQVARAARASQPTASSMRSQRGLIVGLSAWNNEEQRQSCLEAGMDEYLVKPLDGRQLQLLLDEAARRAPTARQRA